MSPVRYCLAAILAVLNGTAGAGEALGIGAELGFTTDSNVTRGIGENELSDKLIAATVNYTWRLPVTERTRVVAQPSARGQFYLDFEDLSNASAGLNLQYQWRPGGGFYSPTLALFAGATVEEYRSDLRDGVRYRYGVSARSPVTDRIGVYGALARDTRQADHTVFETENNVLTLLFDYAALPRGTVYLGFESRAGDVVADTRVGPPPYYSLPDAPTVRDDAFPGTGLYAYRADGDAQLYTLGFNFAFGAQHALDFSARFIRSSVDLGYDYDVTQLTLAWLGRF